MAMVAGTPQGIRAVWQDDREHFRIVAREWDDGMPPSYGVQIFHGGFWQWCESGDDYHRALGAVARWLDAEQGKEAEPCPPSP
jgi:hypothetical protein